MNRQIDMYSKSLSPLKEAANYKAPQPMRASFYSKPCQPDHHQYEDPTILAEQILSRNTGARKKQNAVYEPSRPFHSSKETKPRKTSRKNKYNHIMLVLIFIVAVSTLILILLHMMGKIGRSCSCGHQGGPTINQAAVQNNFGKEELDATLRKLKSELSLLEQELESQDEEMEKVIHKKSQVRAQLQAAKAQLHQKDKQLSNAINHISTMIEDQKRKILSKLSSAFMFLKDRNIRIDNSLVSFNLTVQQIEDLLETQIRSTDSSLNNTRQQINEINSTLSTKNDELSNVLARSKSTFDFLNATSTQMVQEKSNEVLETLAEANNTLFANDVQLKIKAMEYKNTFGVANTTLYNKFRSYQLWLSNTDSSISKDIDALNSTLTEKVNNVSKQKGYRGETGPTGPEGEKGVSGLPGSTSLNCVHQKKTATGSGALTAAFYPNSADNVDKKVMGATCSVNINTEMIYTKLIYKTLSPDTNSHYDCECTPKESHRSTTYKCILFIWTCL